MSDQDDDQNAVELGRVSSDLTTGLQRCSGIVRDYRSRLIAANSNDPFMLNGEVGNNRDSAEVDSEQSG